MKPKGIKPNMGMRIEQDTEHEIKSSLAKLEKKKAVVCRTVLEILRVLAPLTGTDPSNTISIDTDKSPIMVEINETDYPAGP